MKKIVVIGGGTGVFTVLTGLKKYPYRLSAIVSMADNGGSTGLLREEFGVLPPGDIRRALIALSDSDNKMLSKLFNYRFGEQTSLKGHSLGNLLLTALENITGNFNAGVKAAVKILNVKGEVIPVTLSSTSLYAQLENGEIIEGETNIDVPKHDGELKIKKIFLKPSVLANPDAIKAILNADLIVLGPGDLYTSVLPNVIVGGIRETIKKSKAKVVYVVNITTKFGETNSFKASDFLKILERYLGKGVIDYCVVNSGKPSKALLAKYREEKDDFVEFDEENFKNEKIKIVAENFLRKRYFLRHDPEKLAKSLFLIMENQFDKLA